MSNELNLSTAMSTTKSIFSAEKAVDGKDGPDPETCDCCSTTENSAISWWRVDMGGMYPVKEVMVYGRKDGMILYSQFYHSHVLHCKVYNKAKDVEEVFFFWLALCK